MTDWTDKTRRRDRLFAAVCVVAVHIGALLFYLSSSGKLPQALADPPIQMINVRNPPPPRPKPPRPAPAKPAPASAPPKIKVALRPVPSPVPIPTPAPASATDASGKAGNGDGTDAGAGSGSGSGAGAGSLARHAVWIGDGISGRDYPDIAKRAGVQGVVEVRFIVRVDGYVRNCVVTRTSGNAELDRLTCNLAEQRHLYQPALNVLGRPMEEAAARRFRFTMHVRRR